MASPDSAMFGSGSGGTLRRGPAMALQAITVLVLVGCGRTPAVEDGPHALPVDVYADTGRTVSLRVDPPPSPAAPETRASVWLVQVSPARAALPEMPASEPVPDTLAVTSPAPPPLAVDDGLKPPLARARAPLFVPVGARGSVELDVRVDERGGVSEVLWAGGTRDTSMMRAAFDCAHAMRFYPAQLAGQPVAVWCRQRFDFVGSEP